MTSLNPLLTIGDQILEAILLHQKVNKKEASLIAIEMMRKVKISDPEAGMHVYPHQFSGGMRPRIMIAMALCCNPDLLIADEPTTALDVTIQAQILHLMRELNSNSGSSIILITHDLGIVAEVCQNVMVMYGGEAVEYAPVKTIFQHPIHPYTCGLLASRPKLNDKEKKPLIPIAGYPPDLFSPPSGCTFYPRCKYRIDRCIEERISIETLSPGHSVRCIRAKEEGK
jgi:oligopeptide transport system ATP-binding protein